MIFAIHRLDAPNKSEARVRLRQQHLEYLKLFTNRILAAGPYVDPVSGEDRGSLFLIEFDSLAEARSFAEDDPFTRAAIFSEVQVWQWFKRVGRATL